VKTVFMKKISTLSSKIQFKITWLFFFTSLFFCLSGFAQEKTIRGTVTIEVNDPLVGVTIQIKGTTEGAVTNASGKFTLKASPQDTLIVSYVGYTTQKIRVGDRTNFNIQMDPSAKGLNEV